MPDDKKAAAAATVAAPIKPDVKTEVSYLGARLSEKSTYGGLSFVIGLVLPTLIHLDPSLAGTSVDTIVTVISYLGMGVGGVLTIFFPEKGSPVGKINPLGMGVIAIAFAGVLARLFLAGLVLAVLFACIGPASAQTATPAPAPIVAKAPPVYNFAAPQPAACSAASCPAFYTGGTLIGIGGNADLIGGGLNNSIFQGGGMVGVDAGYRFWNGSWYFGGEVSALLQSQAGGNVTNFAPGGFVGIAGVKLGGNAAAFFDQGSTPATQGAISIPQQLKSSLMAPYIEFADVIRSNGSEFATGAGAEFVIGGGWTMDVAYLYAPAINSMAALNLIKLGINFNWK